MIPTASARTPPWVIAHRGASRDCPENTFAAFDEALRQGCDAIELDVQLSRDGVPVVYHDKTLTRAGGGRKRVHRVDARELNALDVGARLDRRFRGQHIPALEAVLDRYGDRTRLLIEIKAREGAAGRERHLELARSVAALVRRKKLERRVILLSFDDEILAACLEHAPEIPRVLNIKPPPTPTNDLRERMRSLDALSANVRTLASEFASGVAHAGLPLLVYTCNTSRRVERAIAAGATGVMSDRPGWLTGYLRSRPGADAT